MCASRCVRVGVCGALGKGVVEPQTVVKAPERVFRGVLSSGPPRRHPSRAQGPSGSGPSLRIRMSPHPPPAIQFTTVTNDFPDLNRLVLMAPRVMSVMSTPTDFANSFVRIHYLLMSRKENSATATLVPISRGDRV